MDNSTNLTSKIHLFQEIYHDPNPTRMDEYIYCINKNIENSSIEKIYLVYYIEEFNKNVIFFADLISHKIKDASKVVLVPSLKPRLTFGDIPKYIGLLAPEDAIIAIANLDVFIPDTPSWENIETEFFSIVGNEGCLALSRTEYINDVWQYREEQSWKKGEFADCWVFKAPLKFNHKDFTFDVAIGNAPQCDSFMFGFLAKKYKTVFNWAEKYMVYHFDLIRKPKKIIEQYNIMITNDNTLNIPTNEFSNACLSPYTDWEEILIKNFKNKKDE